MIIIYYSLGSGNNFVTANGRTNSKGVGKNIGIDLANGFSKIKKNEKIKKQTFKKISECLKDGNLLQYGIRFLSGVTYKEVANGIHSLLNNGSESTPLIGNKISDSLGENKARYDKYHYHIGIPTSGTLKEMSKSNNIDFNEKLLADSKRDYQGHEKRKNLTIKSGFDRKNFCFFMEDTFMSVNDYLIIYDRPYNKPIEELVERNSLTKIYGCAYYTKTQFKFTNTMDYYNVKIILHLVKITDLDADMRSLVEDVTNNNKVELLDFKESNNLDNSTLLDSSSSETEKTNIRGKKEEEKTEENGFINTIKKVISLGSIFENHKNENVLDLSDTMRVKVKKLNRLLQHTSDGHKGRIPEDEQYSDPNYTDRQNKISINFETSLKTKLTDSLTFNQKAKIVESWYKNLTPGSIWEFNLEHHLGKGIPLNHLVDLSYRNKEHPAGYVFIMEQFGDRRGKIKRIEDDDLFSGYSPSKVNFEFNYKLGYLSQHSLTNIDNVQSVVYRQKKREEDFDENQTLFQQEFCPDRESQFNVDFNEIQLSGARKKNHKYKLVYDSNLLSSSDSIGENIKNALESFGLDANTITENDYKYSTNIQHSTIEEEGDIIDLDSNETSSEF